MSSVPVYPCAQFLGSGINISQNLGRKGLMFFILALVTAEAYTLLSLCEHYRYAPST